MDGIRASNLNLKRHFIRTNLIHIISTNNHFRRHNRCHCVYLYLFLFYYHNFSLLVAFHGTQGLHIWAYRVPGPKRTYYCNINIIIAIYLNYYRRVVVTIIVITIVNPETLLPK